ncbi:MAG TPA: hypothetical protein VII39_05735, partial [Bradyrhizobium sp.]
MRIRLILSRQTLCDLRERLGACGCIIDIARDRQRLVCRQLLCDFRQRPARDRASSTPCAAINASPTTRGRSSAGSRSPISAKVRA